MGAGVLCSAQVSSTDAALKDMFDRAYSIVCRDAAVPVGRLYALKARGGDPAGRLAALRGDTAECGAAGQESIDGLGAVAASSCQMKALDVGYRVYEWREGDTLYVAEGLAGYDSALRLGLRTLVADEPVDGEVSIATTEAGDPAAFARVQAGTLDPQRALEEAYRWVVPVRAPAGYQPTERITLTLPVLNRARTVIVLAGGARKRRVIAAVLSGDEQAQRLPIARVRPTGRLAWFLDDAAAGRVRP